MTRHLLDLSHRTDPLGVFSVYVNADPTRREATAIDIKNRYDAGAEVGPGGEPATPEPRLTGRLGERARHRSAGQPCRGCRPRRTE
jgi:hypothetical protein